MSHKVATEILDIGMYASTDDIEKLPWDTTILVKVFDNEKKTSGYAHLHLGTNIVKDIEHGPYSYTTRVHKAKHSDDILFYQGKTSNCFPDLIHTKNRF